MSLGVRPVGAEDRERLLTWRNSDRVRSMSVNDALIDQQTHDAWFERLLAERADQVLIVTTDDAPVGVVALERLDRADAVSGWGCHLGRTDVPPGLGAALPVLGLGFGFERHGLRRMIAEVLAVNTNMTGIHRRLGVPIEGTRREAVRRSDGATCDVIEYGVLRAEWPAIRETAEKLLPRSVRADLAAVLDDWGASGAPS